MTRHRWRRGRLATTLLVAACVLAGGAPRSFATPRALTIKIKSGDTAVGIAKRYYGQAYAARLILLANGMDGFARRLPELKAGSQLELPTAWSYRIRAGDTFAALAQDYLDDAKQARFLAWVNGKNPKRAAPHGHVIIFPALVELRVPRKTTVAKLAARLLAQSARSDAVKRLARRIKKYNGLQSGKLSKQQRLRVPLIRMRLLGWFLATGLARSDPGTTRRVKTTLARVVGLLRKGRYIEVVVALGHVVSLPGLDDALKIRAHHLQCTAYVALGKTELALAAARKVLDLAPAFKRDPKWVSPKVRRIYRRAAAKAGAGAGN